MRENEYRLHPHWVVRLMLAAFNLYGLTMTVLLLIRFLIGEREWLLGYSPIGLVNSLIPLVLLPAPVFLLLLLLRRRLSAVFQVLPVALLVIGYAGLFIGQQTPEPAPDEPRFSVLTFNLYASNHNAEGVIDQIRAADADIVAMQELTSGIAEQLEAEFAADYPYQVLAPDGSSVQGAGIISRLPLDDVIVTDIVFNQQVVSFDVADEKVTLLNVHLPVPGLYGLNTDRRSHVLDQVLLLVYEQPTPLLVVGDFNLTDSSDDYQRIVEQNGFADAFRTVGFGFGASFPDWRHRVRLLDLLPPLARIDYQFYSEGIRPLQAWTSDRYTGSDHRAVYVEYQLTGQPLRQGVSR